MRQKATYDILCRIHAKLRLICWSKYEARLFAAAYSIAFFGALRVGKVVCEVAVGGHTRGLLLSDISVLDTDLQLNISRSKTKLGQGALLRLPVTLQAAPCPVRDVRRFLKLRSPGVGPLLIHQDGSALTRQQFTCVLWKAIAACGLPATEFAAHSFRIGAATTAVHWGLSVHRIKNVGRWKSETYRGHIRERC